MPLVLDGNGDITGLTTGALEAAAIGTGAIRQVVQGTTSTRTATTSTSLVNTNLTATITPTSSSSRIVVFGQTQLYTPNVGSAPVGMGLRRGNTLIWASAADAGPLYYTFTSSPSSVASIMMVPFAYTDSPSTTSPTTYTIAISSYNGSSVEDLGGATATRHTATIILMEIA